MKKVYILTFLIILKFNQQISADSIFSRLRKKDNYKKKNTNLEQKNQSPDLRNEIKLEKSYDHHEYINQNEPYIYASNKGIKAVVFIKTTTKQKPIIKRRNQSHPSNPFDSIIEEFFKKRRENFNRPKEGAGSGVIYTQDGYIITNNHVVHGADKLEVTLYNGKKFKAKLIGQDANTDLAVIKIDSQDLPFLKFADSKSAQIGQRVLAIGNPFGLKATVTNGIISAKGRSRSELNPMNPLELGSFIQTNAPINVGNSGGALINLNAEIVGINTAMIAPVSGYGFAIPSNIVKKVVSDLVKYGILQKGILNIAGINVSNVREILDLEPDDSRRKKFLTEVNERKIIASVKKHNILNGVLIINISKNRAADKAGLKPYDIIQAINDIPIKKMYELQEILIQQHKPGDKIKITYKRNGVTKITYLILETDTKYRVIKSDSDKLETNDIEGAVFENIDKNTKIKLNIKGGARIKKLNKGKWMDIGLKKGFIITHIICYDTLGKHYEIDNIKTLCNVLNGIHENKIVIEGISNINNSKERKIYALVW